MNDLESLIRQAVKFGRVTSKGFEQCICEACKDYKERGAFNFSDGVTYSCFNCGVSFGIKYGRASKDALSVLEAFGLDMEAVKQALARDRLEAMGNPNLVAQHDKKFEKLAVVQQPTIELPPQSIDIRGEHEWCEVARAYIESRGLTLDEVRAYVSLDPKYEGRLIMPVYDYTDERLVYWQARSMDDSEPRFKNPVAGKETAIFNEAALHQHGITAPLYVTEGIFDAWSCGKTGIAPMGSKLTEQVLHKLRRASLRGRTIVFVIDKNNNGYELGMQVLKEGWKIVVMPDNITDANKCRQTLGRMYLTSWLVTQQQGGVAAELTLKLKCKGKK